ncbi:hypothetical protein NQ318_001285 [Aromia moschata]|uniref:Uncharacterized protein n=1 Tax=Aromia moschata TaxID=1265417 RepID=A0AAV8ZHK5_9CUCU|nr:hypothetical protein NQ318_001285 [Aromia moschata]
MADEGAVPILIGYDFAHEAVHYTSKHTYVIETNENVKRINDDVTRTLCVGKITVLAYANHMTRAISCYFLCITLLHLRVTLPREKCFYILLHLYRGR